MEVWNKTTLALDPSPRIVFNNTPVDVLHRPTPLQFHAKPRKIANIL